MKKKYQTEEERKTANREASRRYYLKNKEKIAEHQAEYYQSNKEKKLEYQAEYYQNNKEKKLEYQAEYYQNNKEKIAEHQAEYYQSNKEKKLEFMSEYYQNNKEKKAEYMSEYQATPKGRAVNLLSTYKSSDKKYNRGECTLTADWIVEHIFNEPCHYCGKTDWHELGCDRIDNSLPHTPENCVPCCDKCNKKRGTTPFGEYLKLVGKGNAN